MAKYLDSKGLSYLWQKIKSELAKKSDNHEHPYLGWASDIKAEDAGKVVVFGTPVYEDGVLTSLPTAVGHSLGRDVASTSVFADEAHVRLGGNGGIRIPLTTTTETIVEGDKSVNKIYNIWDIPFATFEKTTDPVATVVTPGIVRSGDDTFEVPSSTDTNWHKAPIYDGYVWYKNDVNSGLKLEYTDGIDALSGKKVIKLYDSNSTFVTQLDATPFIKDGMLESVQILKFEHVKGLEGAEDTKIWKKLDGDPVSVIDAPKDATDDSIWMYFVWKTVHHNPNNVEEVLTEKTASWLPATSLINDCSADDTRGLGTDTNTDGGNLYYVKTTKGGELANANVTTGFDNKGNVVGYIDLSDYQKVDDYLTKADMDAIFTSAEETLAENNNVPTYPTKDPLAGQGTQVPDLELPEFPNTQV